MSIDKHALLEECLKKSAYLVEAHEKLTIAVAMDAASKEILIDWLQLVKDPLITLNGYLLLLTSSPEYFMEHNESEES